MTDTNVYNSDELEVIYSCAQHLDNFWIHLKSYSHWEANRVRLMFKLITEKAIKTGQIITHRNLVDKFVTTLYLGPWGKSIELSIYIVWKGKPSTRVKSIYEKPAQIS